LNTLPHETQPVHHTRQMRGRDPNEEHRATTPLELLFDLTFATAIGLAAPQFAQTLAGGNYAAAFEGFSYATFAICWAWVNFSWFASAYDIDDWIFRLATMVQMTGVLVVAIGLPRMFASIDHGGRLDNRIMVLGYVIMRIAMVFQWLRAAKQDPPRRRSCLTYALTISIAQVGWVLQILIALPPAGFLTYTGVLLLIEFVGPLMAERKNGGTPWHASHIADRYSCFAIIALGEGVVGTVAALSAVVGQKGWTVDAALVCIAGVGLTFGTWWLYYLVPSSQGLQADRNRAFVWGFGQMVGVVSIVAIGAGFRVAAYFIAGKAHVGALATVLAVAIPVTIYIGSVYGLYYYLIRRFDRYQAWLLASTLVPIAIALVAVLARTDVPACLAFLVLAPVITIMGYEVRVTAWHALSTGSGPSKGDTSRAE
jgi:low temperature requirement protein LtrA